MRSQMIKSRLCCSCALHQGLCCLIKSSPAGSLVRRALAPVSRQHTIAAAAAAPAAARSSRGRTTRQPPLARLPSVCRRGRR